MNMKIVKRIGVFFLVLLVLLAGSSMWINKLLRSNGDQIKGRSKPIASMTAEPAESLDIVVVGDSESYNTVSTMELWEQYGITTFDCGQTGQRIQEAYYALKTAFRTQSPKLVIVETNMLFRDKGTIKNVQMSLAEPLRYYFPVFRYHNIWKTLFDDPTEERTDYKGFRIREQTKAYTGKDYLDKAKKVEEISPFAEIYMEKIQKLCDKNGAQILFISAPSPVNYNGKRLTAVQNYAKELNIPYIDFNSKLDEIGLDWSKDSLDKGDHLNIFGAKKATEYLGKYLAENYTFEDHRGDTKYSEWDDLSKEYNAEFKARTEKVKGASKK